MTTRTTLSCRLLAAMLLLAAVLMLSVSPAGACTVTVGDCVTGDGGSGDDGQTTTTTTQPPATTTTTAPPPAPAGIDAHGEARLLELINRERSARNLPLMSARSDVALIAREHSTRMEQAGTIFHNDAYTSAATRNALDAAVLGENVAFNNSIDDAHARLMASPGHRANILDARFTVAGLGVVRTSSGVNYITQDFVQPRSTAPAVMAGQAGSPGAAPSGAPAADGTAPLVDDDEPAVSVRAARSTAGDPVALQLPDGGAGGALAGVAPLGQWGGQSGLAAGAALLGLAAGARWLQRRAVTLAV